ncbi:MAG: VWA-like domain-containing protein [Sutterellaceae bacterium]|nr:VWA-like domain-containing protein [Sutterellaceae bacterium]
MPGTSPEKLAAAREKVLKARIAICLRTPYLSTAILALPMTVKDGMVPTAATDGYRIYVNPAFVEGLTEDETRGLLAHELLHALWEHPSRRMGRNAFVWNIACDYAINIFLTDFGYRIPAGGLLSEEARDKTAEEIYRELMQNAVEVEARPGANGKPRRGGSSGGRSGGARSGLTPDEARGKGLIVREGERLAVPRLPESDSKGSAEAGTLPSGSEEKLSGDHVDPGDPVLSGLREPDDPDRAEVREITKGLRRQVVAEAKSAGKLPGKDEGEIAAAGKPSVDWRSLLRMFLTDRVKTDWSLYPPSKRFLWQGLYLPSVGVPALGRIVLAIDTSGSMTVRELSQILSEIQGFRETFPSRLTVVEADAEIQKITDFDTFDEPDFRRFRIHGGGGTDFRPVFKWVEEKGTEDGSPCALIYATDGYGTFPKESSVPTFWLMTPSSAAEDQFPSWGICVKLPEDDA